MADSEPFRVICLVSAEFCLSLRSSFQQPVGVADRRAKSEQLVKNLMSKAPACRKQGAITCEAEAYLIGWAQGSWPRIPRPVKYKFLELRRFAIVGAGEPNDIVWTAPRRFQVYTLLRSGDESDDGDDDAPLEV